MQIWEILPIGESFITYSLVFEVTISMGKPSSLVEKDVSPHTNPVCKSFSFLIGGLLIPSKIHDI